MNKPSLNAIRTVVDVAASLAVVVGVGLLVWQQFNKPTAAARREMPVPKETITLDKGTTKGDPRARFALVEFSEFECPYCQKFTKEILPVIDREFVQPGLVRVSFKHYPLAIHKLAPGAARAAECASQQQQFWPLHDRLFARTEKLSEELIAGAADGLQLNLGVYRSCLSLPATQSKIDRDTALAKKLGVTGTPAFFFGEFQSDGRVKVSAVLTGARPVADFRKLLAPAQVK